LTDLDRPALDVDERIEDVVRPDADVYPIAEALAAQRHPILQAWLATARAQPFHAEHPDRAVADHIPALLDAVIGVLQRSAAAPDGVEAPMDDPAVVQAATEHARARFEQGLGPVAVVTEFRLLRHEIGRALIEAAADAPAADLLAGQAIIDDALDGACTVGLDSLSSRIETLREEFLATTLHDVRQPITLVTGSLDLAQRWLQDAEPDTAKVAEVVGDAVVAVTEINAMLDTLGDATRVAMGSVESNTEPASLEAILEEALALLGHDARARIQVDAQSGPRLIGDWDANQLRRVVGNVVGNALKYSPDGGPIEIRLGQSDHMAELTVRDHGMGFTDEEREATFGRFVRAERARARGIPGLGLGLYATRGIVSAHGGLIDITSAGPGLGSTVEIRLPLLVEEPDA
jgi:signal transduction histidine kinase